MPVWPCDQSLSGSTSMMVLKSNAWHIDLKYDHQLFAIRGLATINGHFDVTIRSSKRDDDQRELFGIDCLDENSAGESHEHKHQPDQPAGAFYLMMQSSESGASIEINRGAILELITEEDFRQVFRYRTSVRVQRRVEDASSYDTSLYLETVPVTKDVYLERGKRALHAFWINGAAKLT
jgi:hypothetical protein